ncbi:alpha/beta hydrolase domain-containing protein [Thermodesulfobacteriota bacterium]
MHKWMKNILYPVAVLFLMLVLSCSKGVDDTSATLNVTGPVEVTSESYPFNAAGHSTVPQDLAAFNYIEEEYFISGKANVYDYDTGGNVIVRTPGAPYTTRILIRRPADKSKFSGNVVVELNNPTALHDMDLQWMFCRDFFIGNGDIWVGITVKPIAVKALKAFNPGRYASMSMKNPQPPDQRCEPEPGMIDDTTPETENGLVWDIVSQVGALLKGKTESNPIRDYDVEYLIATGYSQTGGYLTTYINLIHPLDTAKLSDGSPVYDGYMIGDGDAFMFPINQCAASLPPGETGVTIKPPGVPVISVVTQGLLNMTFAAWRPDSDTPEDRYRRYEIPGSAHVNQKSNDNKPNADDIEKAGVPPTAANCAGVNEYGVTDFPIEFFMNSAYSNLYTWLRTGTPPPRAEPILAEKAEGKDEIEIMMDEHGNALGGVRNPYVEIPLATYYGQSRPLDQESGFFCMLAGYRESFDNAKIKSLYPTREDYLDKVNTMVDKMVEERFLTKSDGIRIKEEALRVKAW